MDFLTLAVTIVVVVITWYHKKFYRRNKLLSKFPTIKSYPLIGSNLSFIGKSAAQIFNTLEQASKDHGQIWRFDLSPFQSNIIVHDPKIAEGILSSQKFLDKSVEYDFIKNWLNDGKQSVQLKTPTFVQMKNISRSFNLNWKKVASTTQDHHAFIPLQNSRTLH